MRVDRIGYLDGLRAVAVLSVVAYHMVAPLPVRSKFEGVLLLGHHGVELFFVLSGFFLEYPVVKRLAQKGFADLQLGDYAAKRLVRILPPYLAAIALFAALPFTRVPAADVVRQLLFLDQGTRFLNPSFWSLPVEFRWYVLFPAALWLAVRLPRLFVAVAAAALITGIQTRAGGIDLLLLPAFMLGILAAFAYVSNWWRWWIAAALPVCFLLAYVSTPNDDGLVNGPLWEAAMFAFIVACGALSPLRAVLSWAPLRFIGICSYSIYLVHEPFIRVMELHGVGPWLAALCAIAIGIAFYYVCERPTTVGRVRGVLLAHLRSPLTRLLQMLSLPDIIRLRTSTSQPVVLAAHFSHAAASPSVD